MTAKIGDMLFLDGTTEFGEVYGLIRPGYYVYLWANEINGKTYSGKGKRRRAWDHTLPGATSAVAGALRKYGRAAFSLTIWAQGLSEAAAFDLEAYCIETFSGRLGYNLTDGGPGAPRQMPEEQRRQLSESRKGIPKSAETRANMAAAQRRKRMHERAEAEELLRSGWLAIDVAEKLGVDLATVYNWKNEAGIFELCVGCGRKLRADCQHTTCSRCRGRGVT